MDTILDKVYFKINPLFYTVAYVSVYVQNMFNGIAFYTIFSQTSRQL